MGAPLPAVVSSCRGDDSLFGSPLRCEVFSLSRDIRQATLTSRVYLSEETLTNVMKSYVINLENITKFLEVGLSKK